MPRTIIIPDQDAVISEIEIAAPPERVFKALVTRAQGLQWGRGSAKEYEHHGEVLEVEPPRVLAYTWFAN